MEELKAIYNDRVVYGLADSSNVYIDAVSLGEVLNCSSYSKLMESDRLWVSADDLAVILEDNNCPTDDFEKWLISIRNIDYKTHALTYNNDKRYTTDTKGEDNSNIRITDWLKVWPALSILRWAPGWKTGLTEWIKPGLTN